MVAAYCASSSLLPPPPTTASTIKTVKPPQSSSNYNPLLPPRKLTRRKNHLRPKILKFLPELLTLPPSTQTSPIITITHPSENESIFADSPTLTTGGTVPAEDELESIQLLATEGVAATQYSDISGNLITGNTLLKIGLGLVGAFVLQTACSVWVLGNASVNKEDEKNLNGLNAGKIFVSEKMEYRINEIRALAREARRSEARNARKEGEVVEDDFGFDGIGKEVNARLAKLESKMGMRSVKLPGLNVDNVDRLEEDEEQENHSDSDEFEGDEELEEGDGKVNENDNLIFKKRFKFRSSSSIPSRSDVKGFGSGGRSVYEGKKSGSGGLRDGPMEKKGKEGNALDHVNGKLHDMDGLRKVHNEKEVGSSSTRSGTIQGTSQVRHLHEATELQTNMGKQNLQKSKKESQESALKSDKDVVNGSNRIASGTKPGAKSDLWWTKLPYVLAVLMRRGPEHEEAGFFSLRSTSQTPYTIAFENHSDANNFCNLLDLYFEDLGDFHADIVPLPVKELREDVKSNSRKIVVVKKGQLKLYAGQPFAEVETALQSLIE